MSALPGQIDQKSMKKTAWTMWKTIERVKTTPAAQWMFTQGKRRPILGRKAKGAASAWRRP